VTFLICKFGLPGIEIFTTSQSFMASYSDGMYHGKYLPHAKKNESTCTGYLRNVRVVHVPLATGNKRAEAFLPDWVNMAGLDPLLIQDVGGTSLSPGIVNGERVTICSHERGVWRSAYVLIG
jgi:hypothetical protein